MGKYYEDLNRFSWYKRREKEITENHKAGFIHDDMPVTNPAILHISRDTLSKLKKVQVNYVKHRTDK